MYADPVTARGFIRRQMGEYLLLGVTTMTAKQRERIEALEVIGEGRKQEAEAMLGTASRFYGRPPHQGTGRMRRLSLVSGEVEQSVRTPMLISGQQHPPEVGR